MPYSSGVFSRLYDWAADKAASIRIRADKFDDEHNDFADGLSMAVLKDGSQTITANLPMSGFKITGLGEPTEAADAATKSYADGVATAKRIVARVATTANVTIATALNDGDTLDGVVLADDDIVLVKDQTAQEDNGVYVVASSPARHASFDEWGDFVGAVVSVTAGTVNADSLWQSMANAGGTLDTTAIVFAAAGNSIPLPVAIASGGTGQTSAANAFAALKQAATDAATGVVELATSAETITGTDTARVVTPAGGKAAFEPLGAFTALNTQTAAYTLALTDAGKNIEVNNSSARQVTVPTNASVAFPNNTYVNVTRYGTGAVTIKGDTGVTINGVSAGTVTLPAQYSGCTIYKRGTNEWVVPNFAAA